MLHARRDAAIRAYDRARAQRRPYAMAAAREAAVRLSDAMDAGRVAARVLVVDARLAPVSHPLRPFFLCATSMRRVVVVYVVVLLAILALVAHKPLVQERLSSGAAVDALKPLPLVPTSTGGRAAGRPSGVRTMLERGGWRVSYLKPENHMQIVNENGANLLRYLFKAGLAGSESGASIRANPRGIFPSTQAVLRFSVRFPANFPFRDGGKLMGVSFADRPGNHASGGEWKANGGSIRFMWRTHPTNPALSILTVYVYSAVRKQAGKSWPQTALDKQGPGTRAVMELAASDAGNSLWWRKGSSDIVLDRNVWYSIAIMARLNTPGRADGMLYIRVINKNTGAVHERAVGDIYYRDTANVLFQELLLVAFFGGRDPKRYAPPYDTYVDFSDFAA